MSSQQEQRNIILLQDMRGYLTRELRFHEEKAQEIRNRIADLDTEIDEKQLSDESNDLSSNDESIEEKMVDPSEPESDTEEANVQEVQDTLRAAEISRREYIHDLEVEIKNFEEQRYIAESHVQMLMNAGMDTTTARKHLCKLGDRIRAARLALEAEVTETVQSETEQKY